MSTFVPRTAEVHIFEGDDESRLRKLETAARVARDEANVSVVSLLDTPEWAELAAQHDAAVESALERATVVTLTALPRKTWRAIASNHPPRDGNRGDQVVGVNEEALGDELVPVSVLKMQPEPDGGRAAFLDAISDAQFEKLYLTAFSLNRGGGPDPKAGLFAALSRSSDET